MLREAPRERFARRRRAHNELISVFSAIPVAVLFVDRDLRIVRYTPASREVAELGPDDVSRALCEIGFKFDATALAPYSRRAPSTSARCGSASAGSAGASCRIAPPAKRSTG